jgi:hypothetical protein
MTGIFEQGAGGVDLAAVARDAELLDRLAVRSPVSADDEVARLLSALASDVDEGLDALLAELEAPLLEQDDPIAYLGTPVRRRARGLRASTIAIVVGATLSVSGVAAAVTGDPFAPYKSIAHAVTHAGAPSPHASSTAKANNLANGTRAKIAHGDLAGARADIAALQTAIADPSISDHDKALLQTRLRNLMRSLANAEAAVPNPQATAKGPKSTPSPQGHHTTKPSSHVTPSSRSTHAPQGGGVSTPKPTPTLGGKGDGSGGGGNGGGPAAQPTPVTTPDPDATAATGGGGSGGSGGGSSKTSHTPRSRVTTSSVTSTDTASHGRSAG